MDWIARLVPARLSPEDLKIAEEALRGLAVRYRETAARQTNPLLKDGFEKRARDCEERAERIRLAAAKMGGERRSK